MGRVACVAAGDFNGANDAGALGDVGFFEAVWIDLSEFVDQLIAVEVAELFPEFRVRRAAFEFIVFKKCLDIEWGAADDDGQTVPGMDVVDGGSGVCDESVKVIFIVWFGDVDEVMLDRRLDSGVLVQVFSRADIESAIDLPRVGADDLAIEPVGEVDT